MQLAEYMVDAIAKRLGISRMTFVEVGTDDERRFEHVTHEVGHALLLGLKLPEQDDGGLLADLINTLLRKTKGRRKYRDEAHVLVASYRLMEELDCTVSFLEFEKASREQRVRRYEWRAALRSPRATWLKARMREYFSSLGVIF